MTTYVGIIRVRFRAKVGDRLVLTKGCQQLVKLLPPGFTVEGWEIDQLAEIPVVPIGRLGVKLCSVGNPDMG